MLGVFGGLCVLVGRGIFFVFCLVVILTTLLAKVLYCWLCTFRCMIYACMDAHMLKN